MGGHSDLPHVVSDETFHAWYTCYCQNKKGYKDHGDGLGFVILLKVNYIGHLKSTLRHIEFKRFPHVDSI